MFTFNVSVRTDHSRGANGDMGPGKCGPGPRAVISNPGKRLLSLNPSFKNLSMLLRTTDFAKLFRGLDTAMKMRTFYKM